jgi:hypothetical protein
LKGGDMLNYFVELLKYTKLIEPHLNERRLLSDLGMSKEQIEKVMEVYDNANIRVQEF